MGLTPGVYRTFVCTCNDDSRAEAQALVAEVKERLVAEDPEREVSFRTADVEANFITCIVISLNWEYGAHISDIYNDMWSAVRARTYDEVDGAPVFRTIAECDNVEHGFAATWKAFADRGLVAGGTVDQGEGPGK